jgi:branched-chain amino acid aminotransferase
MSFKVLPSAISRLKGFSPPKDLGFGKVLSPVMMSCVYQNDGWGDLELIPFENLSLSPTCKVFHYGQEMFEGLKAYATEEGESFLFRPRENCDRLNRSARRMAIPELPEEIFLKAVKGITAYSSQFIPVFPQGSLYIRPFIIATEEHLGIAPSQSFRFLVVAAPSQDYFKNLSLKILIEREFCRAFPGGTGTVKTGGNYGASLISSKKAKTMGFDNVLWLDALEKKYIEEFSGMNFFAYIDGALVTPKLNESILAGITRDSIIHLASDLKIPVEQRDIEIDEFIELIKYGKCTEAFSCGTAASITPVEYFGEEDGRIYRLEYPRGKVATLIKNELESILMRKKAAPENWLERIDPVEY